MENVKFSSLGLSPAAIQAILVKGFEEPTEIQSKIIPLILENKYDLIGQAQTGTGKTAAFALPLIDMIDETSRDTAVLILVPTRELAIQVSDEIHSLRGTKEVHVAPIYGGQSYDTQLRRLKRGLHIIVGTPGRVIDLMNKGHINISNIRFAILDEADEMLNMGFIEDIETILAESNDTKKVLLFSATMPDRILMLTKKYMKETKIVRADNAGKTIELTDQIYFEVRENEKFDALCRIIDTTDEFYGLIFCRTRTDVDFVSSRLIDRGYDAESLHGENSQSQREKVLGKFRKKTVNILVATDVAARGLDIFEMTHVINYALPQDPESYLHRIGRTGRAGKEGTAITFVTPDEYRKLSFIQRIAQTNIRKERIPQVKDIINFKKNRIKRQLKELVETGITGEYDTLVKDLLKHHTAEEVCGALIKYSFRDELEEGNYAEVEDIFENRGRSSDKRGFKGRADSYSDRRGDGRRGREEYSDRRGGDRGGERNDRNDRGERDYRGGNDRRDRDDRGTSYDKPKEFRSGEGDWKKKLESDKPAERGGRFERTGDKNESTGKRFGDKPERNESSERGGRNNSDRFAKGDRTKSKFGSSSKDDYVDVKGKTRVFLAVGRKDELTPKDLLHFLKKEAKVSPDRVRDLQIMDSYSFITVPFSDAQTIVEKFKTSGRNNRPLAEIAKERDK